MFAKDDLDVIDSSVVSIAAVNWAESLITSGGGVYAQFFNLADMSDPSAYTDILPDATWAYVVTWYKMTPKVNASDIDESQVSSS